MIERESSSKLCSVNRLVYSKKHFICDLIGRSVLALGFLLPNESYFFSFFSTILLWEHGSRCFLYEGDQ